jgi:DedD protein
LILDNRLTQRLVGAAVITALAVIFVPEMLEWQPRETPPAISTPATTQPRRAADTPAMTFSQPKSEPAPAPATDQVPAPAIATAPPELEPAEPTPPVAPVANVTPSVLPPLPPTQTATVRTAQEEAARLKAAQEAKAKAEVERIAAAKARFSAGVAACATETASANKIGRASCRERVLAMV